MTGWERRVGLENRVRLLGKVRAADARSGDIWGGTMR